jgi:DNA polymerase elongation subunit (family B)
MKNQAYIYVQRCGPEKVKHMYVDSTGNIIKKNVHFKQKIWVPQNNKDEVQWRDIHGKPLLRYEIEEKVKDYIEANSNVGGFDYAGDLDMKYQFIAEEYKDGIDFDFDKIPKCYFDCEMDSSLGFPDEWKVQSPIVSIAFYLTSTKKKYVYGLKDYTGSDTTIAFKKFIDEKEMISHFFSMLHMDVACLIGWNSDGFDIPYLINRAESLGIELKEKLPLGNYYEKGNKFTPRSYCIPGLIRFDWMNLVKKYELEKFESYSLDYVAKKYLGKDEGKIKYLTEFKTLHELYEKDYNRFIEYNMKDVMLIVDLENEKSFVDISFQLAYMSKCLPEDIYSSTKIWDVYIYNILINKGIVIPKNMRLTKTEKFDGAFVSDPKRGMHDWVLVRDVASEYPSCMVSANMSAMTKVEKTDMPEELLLATNNLTIDNILTDKVPVEVTEMLKKYNVGMSPDASVFKNDKQDFICEIIAHLFKDRKKYKSMSETEKDPKLKSKYKQLVYTIKILLNSLYGAVGSEYFRYGDVGVAVSVTRLGKTALLNAMRRTREFFMEKFEYDPVTYGDTDSMYLTMGPVVEKWIAQKGPKTNKEIVDFVNFFDDKYIAPIIEKSFQEVVEKCNLFTNHFKMEREKICHKVLFSQKKKYIMATAEKEGKFFDPPKFEYKGIEIVRTSTPQIVRDKLIDTVKFLFSEECKDVSELSKYVRTFRDEWHKFEIKQIAFPRGVSKMSKYKPTRNAFGFQIQKGTPVAVKAAWVYNDFIARHGFDKSFPTIGDRDKIKWVYLKKKNPFNAKVMGFIDTFYFPEDKDFDLNKYTDKDMQFTKSYFEVVKKLVEAIGWNLTLSRANMLIVL